jgi:aspartyl-tRNA synthetase
VISDHPHNDQKTVQFVIVRDPTGLVQVSYRKASDEAIAATIADLTVESAVAVEGKVVRDDRVKLGQIEIELHSLDVVGPAESPLPINERSSPETRLDWRFLDLRDPAKRLMFEIETAVQQKMREYLLSERFIEIHAPRLMGSPAESGAELFELDYFGRPAYLAPVAAVLQTDGNGSRLRAGL